MSGKSLDPGDHSGEYVGVVVALLALEYHAETLKAHSGVNVVGRQGLEFAVGLPVVLQEHEVPYLDHERVALVHELASRNPCDFILVPQVDVDFAAGAARTGVAHLPEIVVLVSEEDVVLREILEPGLPCLLVQFGAVLGAALEHGGVELGLVNAVNLGEELPGPAYGLGLEIVPETPVSEHLEHRVVVRVVAYLFEIIVLSAHAEAFLRVGRPAGFWSDIAEKYVLELVHSGIGKHQSRVILDHHWR